MSTVLLVLAAISFGLGTINVSSRVNTTALGLLLVTVATLAVGH